MHVDGRLRGLIAVGASIGANCRPCLHSSIALAMQSGADEEEIRAAIAVGRRVRHCAAGMAAVADDLDSAAVRGTLAACCPSVRKTTREGATQ